MASTVDDLLAWDQSLYGDGILTDSLRNVMFTPNGEQSGNYGYGWRIIDYERADGKGTGTLIRHGGVLRGFTSNLHRYIDDRITVIVLANLRGTPVMTITQALADTAMSKDVAWPRRARSFVLWDRLQTEGIESASLYYHDQFQADDPKALNGDDLHRMGHELRRAGRFDDALAVFHLFVAVHPASWDALSDLGRVFLENGQREQAAAAFRKAVELDTNGEAVRARNLLEELGG